MARQSYYDTPHWKALKSAALKRDGYRCTVLGCPHTVRTSRLSVDHKDPRPRGVTTPTAKDVLPNLRTLCKDHDNQVMQTASGERRNGGEFVIRGCDADGWPLDPKRR